MKKTDIREGITYQTKNGSAARKVLLLTEDRSAANSKARYKTGEVDDKYIVYIQDRGPGAGITNAVPLSQFARWAYSEDAGAPAGRADLSARISQLEADNAALMEVARAGRAVDRSTALSSADEWIVSDRAYARLSKALSALPAHLKEQASK